jgi:hypothetical protein
VGCCNLIKNFLLEALIAMTVADSLKVDAISLIEFDRISSQGKIYCCKNFSNLILFEI